MHHPSRISTPVVVTCGKMSVIMYCTNKPQAKLISTLRNDTLACVHSFSSILNIGIVLIYCWKNINIPDGNFWSLSQNGGMRLLHVSNWLIAASLNNKKLFTKQSILITLQWRQNVCDGVSIHQPHHCLFNRLFRRRSQSPASLAFVRGIYRGPVNSRQMASNAENVSIWWRFQGRVL